MFWVLEGLLGEEGGVSACVSAFVRVYAYVCMRVCVTANVRAYVCVRACVCVRVCACFYVCMRALILPISASFFKS